MALRLTGIWVMFLGVVLTSTMLARAEPQAVTIAAASDLGVAFEEVVVAFKKKTGTPVKLSLGASGDLFEHIQKRAPYDLYFSADTRYPMNLEQSGYAVPDSFHLYAVGHMALWVPKQSSMALETLGMDALLDPSVQKIAIANPDHSPYGRAAVTAMQYFKVYDRVKEKLVVGKSIAQDAQMIESGAVDIGIIALSLALAPGIKESGRYWEIPSNAHPPLEQGVVRVKAGRNPEGAKAFLAFMYGAEGQQIMQKYGLTLPTDKHRP